MPEVIFDSDKNAANRANHGVYLSAATRFDFDDALIFEDDRMDYGETRWVAIGRIGDSLFNLVYTWRGPARRAISLRRADKRDRELYHARGLG